LSEASSNIHRDRLFKSYARMGRKLFGGKPLDDHCARDFSRRSARYAANT
jgi:hypothetical protein